MWEHPHLELVPRNRIQAVHGPMEELRLPKPYEIRGRGYKPQARPAIHLVGIVSEYMWRPQSVDNSTYLIFMQNFVVETFLDQLRLKLLPQFISFGIVRDW